MVNAVIVDDMSLHRDNLSNLLKKNHPDIRILAECTNVDEGIEAITKHHPDLIFLDVEMPGKTGFDLVREIQNTPFDFQIIFTTAHEHYALQAIKASAFDFLLKPVVEEDLRATLERLMTKRTQGQVMQQMQVLFQHYAKGSSQSKKIALPTVTGYIFKEISDIVRCEADRNYSVFFFTDKSKIVVSKSLKEWEEILSDSGFFRSHSHHLINLSYIKEYIKGEGGTVIMNDGTEIEVSRRKKDEFLMLLNRARM